MILQGFHFYLKMVKSIGLFFCKKIFALTIDVRTLFFKYDNRYITLRLHRNFLPRTIQLCNGLPAAVFPSRYDMGRHLHLKSRHAPVSPMVLHGVNITYCNVVNDINEYSLLVINISLQIHLKIIWELLIWKLIK